MAQRTPHPWAVLDGDDGRPRFHIPSSYPPIYAVDDALEQLWRRGQTMQQSIPELNTITVGDALAFVSALPDESVPLYLFSPPYNLGNSSGGGIQAYRSGHYRKDAPLGSRGGNAAWKGAALASGYDGYDDAMPPEEYKAWQQSILRECWRSLSNDGAIYYVHKPRIQNSVCQTPLDFNPGNLILRQIVIWARDGGFNWNPTYYCPTHEWIVIFAKPAFRLINRGVDAGGDVWRIPAEKGTWHPAPFPLTLAERVIATTMPAFVVDPFIGSGTTAVAAKKFGVDYLGNELNESYAIRARAWVARTRKMTLRQQTITDALAEQQEAFV